MPTQEGTAQTLPQRRLNGKRDSVRVFMFLRVLFLAIRIHRREEERKMIGHTIKKLVNNARRNRRMSRQAYKQDCPRLAHWLEGKAEAFMTSARIVKHDK